MDTNGHQFPEKEATTDGTDNTHCWRAALPCPAVGSAEADASDKLGRVPPALTWCPSAFRTLLVSTNAMDLCHPREPSRSLGMQHPHGAGDEKVKRSARSVPPAKASLQSSLVPQRSSPKPYGLDGVSVNCSYLSVSVTSA